MKRALMAALAMAGAAHAQETPAPAPASSQPGDETQGRVIFAPDFFARFAPRNALDMVSRVPGFTLDEGEDRRGFSGAAGNVLIDGRRPSAKSQALSSILSRIPAAQVLRIELIRDAASTSDAAGQSTLVNIVRTPSAGDGVWEATLELAERGRVSPRGEASWAGRSGALDYSFGVSRYVDYWPLMGQRFFTDGAGDLETIRTDVSPRTYREAAVNGEATFPLLGGSMRTNAQIDRWNFLLSLDQFDFAEDGTPSGDSQIRADERRQNEELGFNFDRQIGPASLELIALATRGHYANDESTLSRTVGEAATLAEQRRRNEYAETIGRGTLSFPMTPAHRLDLGGEIALNSLDARQEMAVDGVPVPDLPASDVLIEENRAEAFATLVWRASPRLNIEATLAGETSTLAQSGGTELETELGYIKPSFQITRRVGERDQIRFRVYRDVGQLDFNDFVSFAGLADEIVVGGNPDLVPETSWRAEIAGDWRFGQDGALGVRLFNHWLSDASDVILVTAGDPPQQFDAPGNIGDGWIHGVQLTATVPLSFLLPGARFTMDNTWQDSEVTDPVTGQPRVISTFAETDLEMHFRQDLPESDFAWGVDYEKVGQIITFRINEIDTYEEGPFVTVFAETTAIPGVKIRAYVDNLLDSPFTRRREFFEETRADGSPVRIEDRHRTRRRGPFWGITLSGSL